MSNEELIKEIRRGANVKENMLALYDNNIGFIRLKARPFLQFVEEADLLQDAYISLVNAVNGFEEDQETSFLTYFGFWLRNGFVKLRGDYSVKIPTNLSAKFSAYNGLNNMCLMQLNRKPTDEEYKTFLGVNQAELDHIRESLNKSNCYSIDAPISETEEGAVTLADSLCAEDSAYSDVIESEYQRELKEALDETLQELTPEYRELIIEKYLLGTTYKDIAERKGVSGNAVKFKTDRALKKLRENAIKFDLASFIYEKNIASIYNGGYEAFCRRGSSTEYVALKLIDNPVSCVRSLENNA